MTTPSYVWVSDGPDIKLTDRESTSADFELECPECGADVFLPDEDGLCYESEPVPCPSCGLVLSIICGEICGEALAVRPCGAVAGPVGWAAHDAKPASRAME